MSNNPAYSFLGRIGSEPMLLSPTFNGLGATVRQMLDTKVDAEAFMSEYAASWGDERVERKPYAFANGIAIIPVNGTLVNRFGMSGWGYTGYDYIRGAFDAALADSSVSGIMLDVDSYGGEVHGCFELSDHIYASRGKKPIMAMVNANCYSAAYATASAADSITLTPSGGAGSIGVVTMHVDYSKALAENGISVSYIFAGKHKVDGNPHEPLPDSVRADIQSRIDATYEKFVALVARNRGVSAAVVRGTEARIYGADEAKAKGLIDSVAPPKAAFAGFANALSGANPTQEMSHMSIENTKTEAEIAEETAAAAAVEAAATAAAEVAAAELVAAEAAALAIAEAAAAVPSERERIKAILNAPEAADRAGLANHFALNTELSVADAVAALAASPKETAAAASGNAFAAAMGATPNPEIGAEGTDESNAELKGAARVIANAKAAGAMRFN
jgi:signal peptide peptidase SppA